VVLMSSWLQALDNTAQDKECTKIYLVRHGQTELNAQGKIQGRSSEGISQVGRSQDYLLSENLEQVPFKAAFSSQAQSAIQTAMILIGKRQIQVKQDSRLDERNYGSWEGRSLTEYLTASPQQLGELEPDDSVSKRAFEFLNETASKFSGNTLLVVTHDRVIRDILAGIKSLSPEQFGVDNAGYAELSYCNGKWSVVQLQGIREITIEPIYPIPLSPLER